MILKAGFTHLADTLEIHEDRRYTPYRCTAGKLTIGIGRNIEEVGLSDDEINYLLQNDMRRVVRDLYHLFPKWEYMSANRQLALADMRFQLGPASFRGFKNMHSAIHREAWDEASEACLDSKYARDDTPGRAAWVAEMLRKG